MRLEVQSRDVAFAVEFDAAVLQAIDRFCSGARDLETGGILIGQYTDDRSTALIVEALARPRGRSRR